MTSLSPLRDWPAARHQSGVYEDDAILVLDKPPGVSVIGERHGSDIVRSAADAGEELFPVHRIDKVTSGLVLLAKSLEVHGGLTRQFSRRSVDKAYLAITRSEGLPDRGTIDLPLSVGRKGRIRVAAPRDSIRLDEANSTWSVPPAAGHRGRRSYPSVTRFVRLWEGGGRSVLLVRPETGRRHQIRVHLAWIGHPIEGDPLFEKSPGSRAYLHSWSLAFDRTWSDGERMRVEATPGLDFWAPIGRRGRQLDKILERARAEIGEPGTGRRPH